MTKLLEDEKKKRLHYQNKSKKLLGEKETLRKQLSKERSQFSRARQKLVSRAKKLQYVKEILKETTKFTDVGIFASFLSANWKHYFLY